MTSFPARGRLRSASSAGTREAGPPREGPACGGEGRGGPRGGEVVAGGDRRLRGVGAPGGLAGGAGWASRSRRAGGRCRLRRGRSATGAVEDRGGWRGWQEPGVCRGVRAFRTRVGPLRPSRRARGDLRSRALRACTRREPGLSAPGMALRFAEAVCVEDCFVFKRSLRWRGGRPGQGPNSLEPGQGKLPALSSVSTAGSWLEC